MDSLLEEGYTSITYVKGYPSLSSLIASDYDHSTFISKRFDRISARNLLYLQSELAELEAQQDGFDREDFKSRDESAGRRDWKTFKSRSNDASFPKEKARMDLMMKIRGTIKEYKEAILLDSAILSMRRPSKQAYEAFHNEFWNIEHPKGELPTLLGASSKTYNNRSDLISLVRPPSEDRLTVFLRKHCSLLFMTGRKTPTGSLAYISSHRITVVVGTVNVILAASFLFGAILNLYYVGSVKKRLGLVVG